MNRRFDPEQPKLLQWIWRPLYCLRNTPQDLTMWWRHTDEQHIDVGYCLDRYLTHEPK